MISMVTLISPISLSNGKFLGRAMPIMVTFTMFENLFQDWDTGMKKSINTLRPRQNGHRFPDDIFKCIFLN